MHQRATWLGVGVGVILIIALAGVRAGIAEFGSSSSPGQLNQEQEYRYVVPGLAADSAPGGTQNPTPTATPTSVSTATVTTTVTVTTTPTPPIVIPDLSPVAVDDVATVDEDSSPSTINVLANDTDPDGGPKRVASVTQPANGTVTISTDSLSLRYEPDLDYCNTPPGTAIDTFMYGLDPGGSFATVRVTVTCVDDLPVANDDSATVSEGSGATTLNVLANDFDADGDAMTIAAVTQPTNGTVVVAGNNLSLTYEPDADYCNAPPGTTPDTFVYVLAPGGDSATVSVTVSCVDDPPSAVDDVATVDEDAAGATIDVLANDTDPDGGPISIASASDPANGTVVIAGDNLSLSYAPDPGYCNAPPGTTPDTFAYTLAPGGDSATVSVVVNCLDDSPVAVDDTATVAEDDPATTVDVLANDTDEEGDPFTIASATQPANGTVVVALDDLSLTYEPDADYCNAPPGTLPDTFTYTLAPGGDTATVSVTVTCVDDPPTAVNDAATVTEDDPATTIDVLANDIDADGDPFTIASTTDPVNGTVVVAGDNLSLTYEPDPSYCNDPPGTTPDTFTYTLAPGGDTATLSVTVSCVDTAPVAVDDAATVTEDASATTIDVLANDTDIDGGPMTIASASDPASGTVVIAGDDLSLSYQPDPNYCNDPPGTILDTFTYTLAPGGATATVSVTVTCVDDPPVAVDDTASVAEDDAPATIDVLANDTDVDGGPMTVASATQPANGAVVVAGDGLSLTYEPDPDYCNVPPGTTPDTFTYTLTGGSTATVSVTVTCVDDPPLAVADSTTVLEDSSATTVNVLANDVDVDGGSTITIASATDPAGGSVTVAPDDLSLNYTPDANFCGADTFDYTIAPGGSTATVLVTVTCVNDEPSFTLSAASHTSNEDAGAQSVAAFATAISPGPANEAGQAVTFNVTDNSNPALFPGGGAPAISSTGTLTYRAAANANGAAIITLALMDNGGTANGGDDTSDTQTFTIVVNPVNDAPVVADTTKDYAAQANMPISIGLLAGLLSDASDSADTGANPGYTANLTVENVSATTPAGGDVAVNADGSFTFTPPAGVTGAVTFTYDVCDDGDGPPASLCTAVTVTFTVAGPVIWFVDDSVVSGDGTLGSPFATLAEAVTAVGADTNERVFLFSGTYGTGIDLNTSGWLIGQAVTGTSFDSVMGISPPTGTAARPAIATGTATLQNTVSLDTSSTVRGIALNTGVNAAMTDNAGATTGVTVNEVSITTTTGNGLVLNDLTVAASTTFAVTNLSKNGAGDAINLTGVTGAVSIPAGTIQNTTSNAVRLSGGSGNFTYGGSVTNSAGRSVEVTGRTSGNVAFSGLVNGTGGTGVSLTTNGASVVTFSGGVTLNTGTNAAFTAAGGGTIVVTGATNTLVTTTGIALNVANTTIGSGGLNFQSISANGAASGIVLNTTGSTAGLTVSGTGSAGTGGTIQGTSGVGVLLTSTRDVSLSWMNVQTAGDDGIRGQGVTNFSLLNSTLTNNGNAVAENGLQFGEASGTVAGITGTLTLTNTTITGSAGNNVHIRNTSGTLAAMNITGSSFNNLNDVTGANSFLFEMSGTAVTSTATISGTSFLNNSPQRALEVQAHETATISDFTVEQSTFTENGIHASFTQDTTANLTFSMLNNTMTFANPLHAINVFSSSTATGGSITGTIQGNTIGAAGSANSGARGNAIRVLMQGRTTGTLLIDGNTIRQVWDTSNGARGIDVQFLGPVAGGQPITLSDVTLTNNNVDTMAPASSFPLAAIYVAADDQGSPARVRANITGNTAVNSVGGGSFDYPTFDGNGAHLVFIEVGGAAEGQLVDTAPASADATAQLTSTNTGTVFTQGISLITGPIGIP